MIRQVPWLCIAIVFLLLGSGASALAGKRVALLIGNSSYDTLPPLKRPGGNVKLMQETLAKAGFDKVETALDLKHDDLIRKLRAFEEGAADADIALIYYCGHSLEHAGGTLILPTNVTLASERDVGDETVGLERLLRVADDAKTFRLIILDSARDNAVGSLKPKALTRCCDPIGDRPQAVSNAVIFYATKAGRPLAADDGPVDAVTRSLAARLFEPGQDVLIALRAVRDDVLAATQNSQEPFVYGSLGSGKITLAK